MAGMISRLSTLTLKIPTIYTVHGWGWRGLNIINKNFIILIEKLFKHIPNCFYIYVSESVESDAINYLKISKKKAKLILNGTADYKVFSQTKLTSPFLQMIMPARVSSAKDHNTLFSAFEMSNINSNLMLCGAGTNDADFIYKASKLAPNRFKDIQFLGERSDINFLYNQSDIFLLISKFEALPLSILEAMSAGKAIIASRVGSIPEFIIDGKNGILVNISDVNDLVLKINSLNDINLRITLGKEARLTYLKNFTIDKMIDEIKTLFFTKTILK
jgi:glycosyltransferase involved in cell wall biosynthesis